MEILKIKIIISETLLDSVLNNCGIKNYENLKNSKGKILKEHYVDILFLN